MGATRCTTGANDAIISAGEPGTRRSCAAPGPATSATARIEAAAAASGSRIRILVLGSRDDERDITTRPGQLKGDGGGDRRGPDAYHRSRAPNRAAKTVRARADMLGQ